MAAIGESDYRNGARERLEEASILMQREQWAGCVYLAGRAVESMLRAIIWKGDPDYATGKKHLRTGHDLRDMLKLTRKLNAIREDMTMESISAQVQKVARLWSNNMRFWPTAKLKREWYRLRVIRGKRTIKKAVEQYYDACSAVVKRSERIWKR